MKTAHNRPPTSAKVGAREDRHDPSPGLEADTMAGSHLVSDGGLNTTIAAGRGVSVTCCRAYNPQSGDFDWMLRGQEIEKGRILWRRFYPAEEGFAAVDTVLACWDQVFVAGRGYDPSGRRHRFVRIHDLRTGEVVSTEITDEPTIADFEVTDDDVDNTMELGPLPTP